MFVLQYKVKHRKQSHHRPEEAMRF